MRYGSNTKVSPDPVGPISKFSEVTNTAFVDNENRVLNDKQILVVRIGNQSICENCDKRFSSSGDFQT